LRLRRDRSRFDIRWFFKELPDLIHTNWNDDDKAYYAVLREYVLLDRFELEQCRIRIGMVNESLDLSSNLPPVLVATQRGTCFVWIAVPHETFDRRLILLQNMICLAKYVTRSQRCVGMSHAKRPDGLIELDMGYLDAPWEHDPLAEQCLAEANPFMSFGIVQKPGYRIN
jgi:hypothetical protein